jgi:hypothetical protein
MAIAKTEQTGEAMGIAKTEQTNASVWWLISALDVFLEVASFYVENKYNVWFLVLSKCTCFAPAEYTTNTLYKDVISTSW